jgi:hypothetical protein
MKNFLLIFLCGSSILFAQYNIERTTEQSFEQSELFFSPHFLNPFGILNFKKVAPGLIDNEFLNLSVNPANLPELNDETLLYLDFRGDRTEAPVVQNYVYPAYYTDLIYRPYPYIDPRWFSSTRSEPEPIFSLGVLTNPIKEITNNFFIGGTYQLIHKKEKFYSVPAGIYYPNIYYDALGVKTQEDVNIPIKDRYSAADEMMTEAHLFSAFAGYKFTGKLEAGLSFDGVTHKRTGDYLNSNSDEYGLTDNNDWANSQGQGRGQKYHHTDWAAGINYLVTPNLKFGIKAGILNGKADQNYSNGNSYYYRYNTPQVSDEWNYSFSNSSTVQSWNHDGSTKYFGFNFTESRENKQISGYFKHSAGDIDLTSYSSINDTSFYTSRYYSSYDTSWSSSNSYSFAHDNRIGTGNRTENINEAMINFKWELTRNYTIYLGAYFNSTSVAIASNEPVTVIRQSEYNYDNTKNINYNYHSFYSLSEDKTLSWNYSSDFWTLQIPIILQFKVSDFADIMVGLNRILNDWEITDQTLAVFKKREKNDNGTISTETNFGERYTQPDQNITEDFTKLFASFDLSISHAFKVRIILDPEFEHEFRLAQWWLGVETRL